MTSASKDTQLAELKKLREDTATKKGSLKAITEGPLYSIAEILSMPLSELPKNTRKERVLALANELKNLGEREMELELLIEEERVQRVVHEYEELHPPLVETCPICLEDVSMNSSPEAYSPFACCGNWVCNSCNLHNVATGKIEACPLCRTPLPTSKKQYDRRVLKCAAEKGQKWAHFQIAYKYEHGEVTGRANMKKAVEHYQLSAEQNHPPAFLALANLYGVGVHGALKKSEAKAKEYMLKAADMGNCYAQANVAGTYYEGRYGKKDYAQAAKYATLASHYQKKFEHCKAKYPSGLSNSILGFLYLEGNGLVESGNLGVHYLEKALNADPTPNGFAAFEFSRALMRQCENRFGGTYCLLGFDARPRVAYWLRKAVAAGDPIAPRVLSSMEATEAGTCMYCRATEKESGKKFLRCGRCRLYSFCSKECQRASWKAGHCKDCKTVFH